MKYKQFGNYLSISQKETKKQGANNVAQSCRMGEREGQHCTCAHKKHVNKQEDVVKGNLGAIFVLGKRDSEATKL